jgi:membrane associated rhomboid family serine protease
MFIFPLRTDRRLGTTPWVNYALIAINVLIFLVTAEQVASYNAAAQSLHNAIGSGQVNDARQIALLQHMIEVQHPIAGYFLSPIRPALIQFFSYQFLHAGWMHIGFNMLFLYVFGNGVEDRLGKVGYLLFYLAAGVLAGLGQCLFELSPILGASGAIAGVTGMYLALFPLSNVTLVYWIFIIGSFEVPSVVLILFRVAQDVLFQLWGYGGTAYMAHIAGYVVGFIAGMGLLLGRVLTREPYDMFSVLEQRRRRAKFRAMAQQGYQPWESGKLEAGQAPEPTPEEQRIMKLRAQITRAMAEGKLDDAARLHDELVRLDPQQVLGQQHQLDLANHLMAAGRYDAASRAYERMLEAYPRYGDRPHVQLILGLIYARYLNQPDRARQLLHEASSRLDPGNRELAQTVLREVE